MILVINEWMFDELLRENGEGAFRETADFVRKLNCSGDKLVVPNKDRWKRKAYRLMTLPDPSQRLASQLLQRILRDSSRSIHIHPDDVAAVPQGTFNWAPSEDVYLLEAYEASGANSLVTSDEKLFQAITEHGQFTCRLRDEFLSNYGSAI